MLLSDAKQETEQLHPPELWWRVSEFSLPTSQECVCWWESCKPSVPSPYQLGCTGPCVITTQRSVYSQLLRLSETWTWEGCDEGEEGEGSGSRGGGGNPLDLSLSLQPSDDTLARAKRFGSSEGLIAETRRTVLSLRWWRWLSGGGQQYDARRRHYADLFEKSHNLLNCI